MSFVKVVTKMEITEGFADHIQEKIDDLVAVHMPSSALRGQIEVKNQNLVTEIRRLMHDAYSVGVEQGIRQAKGEQQ